MDDHAFDRWTRSLTLAGSSRRAIGKALAGGTFAALLSQIYGPGEAGAKCVAPGRKCRTKRGKRKKCCGGARCGGRRCKCTAGRARCGRRCCAKGQICAGRGVCVTGQGTCQAGADSCAAGAILCNGTCFCVQRLEGGTRCADSDGASRCGACTRDADCRALGYPAGSTCFRADGAACGCPPDGRGGCAAPCGLSGPL